MLILDAAAATAATAAAKPRRCAAAAEPAQAALLLGPAAPAVPAVSKRVPASPASCGPRRRRPGLADFRPTEAEPTTLPPAISMPTPAEFLRRQRHQGARQPVGAPLRPRTGRRSRPGHGHRPEGTHHPGRRPGLRQGRAGRRRGAGGTRRQRRLAAAWICCPGRRSTSPSSAPSRSSRCRASRRSPAPTSPATG